MTKVWITHCSSSTTAFANWYDIYKGGPTQCHLLWIL